MTNTYETYVKNLLSEAVLKISEKSRYRVNLGCFAMKKGSKYNRTLFVVGRATNGAFGEEWSPAAAIDRTYAERIAAKAISGHDCRSMDSIWSDWKGKDHHYNPARSAFWRVTRKIHCAFDPSAEFHGNWFSRSAWSNLYKIAPYITGNPSDSLCEMQLYACRRILEHEISFLQPNRILFLTGYNWANAFCEKFDLVEGVKGNFVDSAFLLKRGGQTSQIVVAKHPQAKPEESFLDEVKACFNYLSSRVP